MDLPPHPPSFYSQHPFLNPHFAISWQELQAQNLEVDLPLALKRAQDRIDQISQQDLSTLSFESTFLALEASTHEVDEAWAKASHLSHVADSPSYREAYRRALPLVSEFYTKIPLNSQLFDVLEKAASLPSPLSSLQERLKEETLYLFKSQGAHLPPEAKSRLAALNAELAEACQKFSENVLDATNQWELIIRDPESLKGLPPLQLKLAENDALAHGHKEAYRLTLHAPSYGPVLQYVESETIRKIVWDALSQVGRQAPYDNTQLITHILALRQEKAALLGKKDFADLILERRMAESGSKAIQFIEDLHAKTLPCFKAQINQVAPSGQTIEPWSLAYEVEKLQKQTLHLDSEALRPYFPLPQVVKGLFYLAEQLFGLKIEKLATTAQSAPPPPTLDTSPPFPVWAPEVEAYTITSPKGSHLGSFYMDLYPRPSKRSGAWANSLLPKKPIPPATLFSCTSQAPSPQTISLSPALGLICANFTPSADAAAPPLLSHEEVQTLYHEFGHLLHIMLGEVPLPSLNGIHVWWDFVELPSQILENWTWAQESLEHFAHHYQTGEVLPEELFKKLQASRTFLSALGMMRQLALSRLDLALHTQPYEEATREAELQALLAPYTPSCYSTPPPPLTHRFTHIFSDPTGYAAGYYSYKWAEVLEADAFTRFQKEGIFNRQTGQSFQDSILSKGNSHPPKVLFKAFLGHAEPDATPLLERYQLLSSPPAP